jgi:hypothetical protein
MENEKMRLYCYLSLWLNRALSSCGGLFSNGFTSALANDSFVRAYHRMRGGKVILLVEAVCQAEDHECFYMRARDI